MYVRTAYFIRMWCMWVKNHVIALTQYQLSTYVCSHTHTHTADDEESKSNAQSSISQFMAGIYSDMNQIIKWFTRNNFPNMCTEVTCNTSCWHYILTSSRFKYSKIGKPIIAVFHMRLFDAVQAVSWSSKQPYLLDAEKDPFYSRKGDVRAVGAVVCRPFLLSEYKGSKGYRSSIFQPPDTLNKMGS